MKKIGEIMAEMGFRKDAPDSVKEAFLKHLIKNATGVDVETPSERAQDKHPKQAAKKSSQIEAPEQLVFDFVQDQGKSKAKVS